MQSIKTLFIGTSEFAVPVLEALLSLDRFEIVGVITQPDKPKGRHHSELSQSAVKEFITEKFKEGKLREVSIFQPEKLKDGAGEIFKKTNPDLVLTASYGQMIPNILLDTPKYKAINVHASLLPRLRGAVPMPMAILQGDKETGVTFQLMAEKLDEGAILSQYKIEIAEDETTESLTQKLSQLAADNLEETLTRWVDGEIKPVEQDNSQATYCYQEDISKDKAEILQKDSEGEIDRKVRAFYPWPVAWLILDGFKLAQDFAGKRLKIFKAKKLEDKNFPENLEPGLYNKDKKLFLRTQSGCIEILECQLEGKQRKSGQDYLFLAAEKI